MDYTTKTGYTYKHLPETLTDDIKEILEAATCYKSLKVIHITDNLLNHLKQKYKIKLGSDSQAEFIFKDTTGYMGIIDNDRGYPFIILNESNLIERKFLKKLTKYEPLPPNSGLPRLLDPNYGGSLNDTTLAYVSLIHFG